MARTGSGSRWIALLGLLACLVVANAWGSDATKTHCIQIASNADSTTHGGPPDGINGDYMIGPSDVLAVNVWKDTELTRTVPVRPDGKISLPLIGELEVNGLTALQVQHLIAAKLKEYIDNPQVTVIVQEVKSKAYVIVGKIAKPGSYNLEKPTTILDAIAIAGGFLDFAKTNKVYVIRSLEGGSVMKMPFDYKSVTKGHHLEENVNLRDGDTIVVP